LACQRRTSGVISNQARFRREQVTFAGKSTAWMRTAESGNAMTYHFRPTCGSTVYWESTLPSATSATRTSRRQPLRYGRSHATPGFPCRLRRAGASRLYWLTQESNAAACALYDQLVERSGFIQYRKLF